jgi:3-hydroxyisobutyrate dehydrogenase-like beta-hydroxyacid dehydrogenase
VVIDTSSSSPFDTRELGAELKKLSIDLVDSPITQEQLHAIDTGGATLMVGCDSPNALEKVLPILKDMSLHVFPMGGLGAGHTMKTLNNYVSVGSIIALCDALVYPTNPPSNSLS